MNFTIKNYSYLYSCIHSKVTNSSLLIYFSVIIITMTIIIVSTILICSSGISSILTINYFGKWDIKDGSPSNYMNSKGDFILGLIFYTFLYILFYGLLILILEGIIKSAS